MLTRVRRSRTLAFQTTSGGIAGLGRAKLMLVLSRKPGEKILIGDKISITVVRIAPGIVRIGVEAPGDLLILREELAGGNESSSVPADASTSPIIPGNSKSP